MITIKELIDFEREVAEAFNAAKIRAPVHLAGGNELDVHEVFAAFVSPGDWVFSTWRSHYHALLHGVPKDKLMAAILDGRSITLCFPEHRFFSSAIVAGACPIALGAAWSIKRRDGRERVWCFVGDMANESGLKHECAKYAAGHELPLAFVCENNGKSVCTPTEEVWGTSAVRDNKLDIRPGCGQTYEYGYSLPWPHAGAGKRVEF